MYKRQGLTAPEEGAAGVEILLAEEPVSYTHLATIEKVKLIDRQAESDAGGQEKA